MELYYVVFQVIIRVNSLWVLLDHKLSHQHTDL